MQNPTQTPGVHHQTLPSNNNLYTIAIPENYDGGHPTPLIVLLHWGGPMTPYIGGEVLTTIALPGLYKLGAIIVAPDKTTHDWANPEALNQIMELMGYIENNYNIDNSKRIITGYSMGGIGTWFIAANHQELFSTAIPMAAKPPTDVLEIEWKIPIHVIHAKQDQVFSVTDTEEIANSLIEKGAPLSLTLIDGDHFSAEGFIQVLKNITPKIKQLWEV